MSYRILFVPVSSPEGVGEYMRSLMIAQSLASQDRTLTIEFILSEKAPYAKDCPFPAHLCPDSPTLHSDIVNRLIQKFKPNIVIFDASGRASQLKAAKRVGAHTIFIAQHNRKLSKGLSWRRLVNTDAIFAVQPKEIMQALSFFQGLKLRMLSKSLPQFVGPVFPSVNKALQESLLTRYSLKPNDFILISAGGGMHTVDGISADELFFRAAQKIFETTEKQCVLIRNKAFLLSPNNSEPSQTINHLFIDSPPLPAEEFIALLSVAKLAILGGGGSLLQALALDTPVLSTPLAKDQHERVSQCGKLFGATTCNPQVDAIISAALTMLSNEASNEKTIKLKGHGISSGLPSVVSHIQSKLSEIASE